MFLQFSLILGLNQLTCRMNSLPFSPASLPAAGIERNLHHHPLLITISPGLAATKQLQTAALLRDGVVCEGPFHFIFLVIKKGNFKNVCLSTGSILFIYFLITLSQNSHFFVPRLSLGHINMMMTYVELRV